MKQFTQKLKTGDMKVLEVPLPSIMPGHILVRNHFSLISAGTDKSTVSAARKGYIGKAQERPQQVRQVLETLKSQGPLQTYRAVMKKLDSYSPLGYSSAGAVIDVAPDVAGLAVGDYVACGGLTACHAEVVSVPVNLCVKLSRDADLKQAAYNTLGAIALQGIRQADLRLGETCAVIGLGLLGQLTALLLRAAGVQVIGIDVNPNAVTTATAHCTDIAFLRDSVGVEERISNFTNGIGCDAVIITAASDSLDPVNFAGAIARKKGTVAVVGNVPTGFDREPHYYRKELQLKMSCSYGPGRYDPAYEEKGLDYPPGYVRWTERRNMQVFQDLIQTGKIDVSYLTTHTFKLDDAPAAYNMMIEQTTPYLGILIEYDVSKPIDTEKAKIALKTSSTGTPVDGVSIGFIGAGSYAQSHLLPNIPKDKDIVFKGVMTASGTSSRSVAERFGFEFSTGNEKDIFENDDINTVFIATRHDSHAHYVIKALQAGKHVFIEKPLCLTEEELDEIVDVLNSYYEIKNEGDKKTTQLNIRPILMVGYNRRFAPLAQEIKAALGDGPMAITYRVNAGTIPADSWIQDTEIGGGRIIGEVCHFVDFLTFINGSVPVAVHAAAMNDPRHFNDVVNISLTFANGSIGTIAYFANGDRSLPKERVEVFANGCTAVLDDFKRLSIFVNGRKKEKKFLVQDKGQKAEVAQFIASAHDGRNALIPLNDLVAVSTTTFKIIESLSSGNSIRLR